MPSVIAAVSCSASWWYSGTGLARSMRIGKVAMGWMLHETGMYVPTYKCVNKLLTRLAHPGKLAGAAQTDAVPQDLGQG